MSLHEIIHDYLRMTTGNGRRWLNSLVRDCGMDASLIPHIEACR